jgi:membrane fusion protein, multidrug efflux system
VWLAALTPLLQIEVFVEAQAKAREPSAETPQSPGPQADSRPAPQPEPKTEPTAEPKSAPQKDSSSGDGARDEPPKPSLRDRLRQHWILTTAAVAVVIAGLIGGLIYWLDARHYESTDDAFVAARSFSIAPKVGGYVTDVPVTDNQHVATGDVLARIDPRDYTIAVEQAQAQVGVAQANIDNIDAQIASQQAQIEQAKAQVEQAEAQLKFSKEEATRAQDLVAKGAGTVQRQQQTNSDQDSQQANTSRSKSGLIAAELQVKVLTTQRESAQASRGQVQAQLDQAQLNLAYTNILAAQPGRVAKLSGAKGAFVNPGQSLMMFVPDEVWITANYKETQLTDMRAGQPVEVRIDAYPSRRLHGHIASVQPGSGTAFSLLPAENATGNYVKVVQRIPVKIVIDDWPADVPVGPGMSAVPWTKVR